MSNPEVIVEWLFDGIKIYGKSIMDLNFIKMEVFWI